MPVKRKVLGTIIVIGILAIAFAIIQPMGFFIGEESSLKGRGVDGETTVFTQITQAFAVSGCEADSGFSNCIINTYNDLSFEFHWDFDNPPFIKERLFKAKMEPTDGGSGSNKLYLLDGRNYETFDDLRRDSCVFKKDSSVAGGSFVCDENVIRTYDASKTAEYRIVGTGEITECPVFLASRSVKIQDRIYYTFYLRGFIDQDGNGKCNLGEIVQCTENSQCSSADFCDEGLCKPRQCEPGQTKCEGFDYYNCFNYEWERFGKIIGKCGVECRAGNDKCEGSEYFTCRNNQWDSEGLTINRCGVECLNQQTKCEGTDYYECENNEWINLGETAGECDIECTPGQYKCDDFDYLECQDNNYENQGKIVGQCGVQCINPQDCNINEETRNSCEGNIVIEETFKAECTDDYTCDADWQKTSEIETCENRCKEGECVEPIITGVKDKTLYWIMGILGFILLGIGGYFAARSGGKR